jgi:hypothetical protein
MEYPVAQAGGVKVLVVELVRGLASGPEGKPSASHTSFLRPIFKRRELPQT